jgi:hypothetical protein
MTGPVPGPRFCDHTPRVIDYDPNALAGPCTQGLAAPVDAALQVNCWQGSATGGRRPGARPATPVKTGIKSFDEHADAS